MPWHKFTADPTKVGRAILVAMASGFAVATDKIVCWVSGYDGDA
jgi:hypothetical protein